MKALILGRNGQLGWALERRLQGRLDLVALGRDALDLADASAVAAAVDAARPTVVFNAAAYTAVDRAETEVDAAYAVNARAPGALAAACARHGALLVHYSTDYVFDGTKAGRWVETDPTGPLSVYGASKLAGEQAILETPCAAVILRTSWVYGEHGANFAKTMLRLATERDTLRVVCDQHGAPTSAGRLAEASEAIALQALAGGDAAGWLGERRGIYHASAAGETTWADYARCVIATAAGLPAFAPRLTVRAEAIEPIPASAYPTPARRPANSLLDGSKLARTFGVSLPDWREDVTAFVQRLAQAG
jgi:dTDP-4-dehydrorhamnose reductase